jgi:hypothetical protein
VQFPTEKFLETCAILQHQHADGVIKVGLEEIAVYNLDEGVGKPPESKSETAGRCAKECSLFAPALQEARTDAFSVAPSRLGGLSRGVIGSEGQLDDQ